MTRRALLSFVTLMVAATMLAGCLGYGVQRDPVTGGPRYDPETGEPMTTTMAEDGAAGAAIGSQLGGAKGGAIGFLLGVLAGVVARKYELPRLKRRHAEELAKATGKHPTQEG